MLGKREALFREGAMLRLFGSWAAQFAQSSHGDARADAQGCLDIHEAHRPAAPGQDLRELPPAQPTCRRWGQPQCSREPVPIRHNSLNMAPEAGVGGSEQRGMASGIAFAPTCRDMGQSKATGSLRNSHLAAAFPAPHINQLRTVYSHCRG